MACFGGLDPSDGFHSFEEQSCNSFGKPQKRAPSFGLWGTIGPYRDAKILYKIDIENVGVWIYT